MNTVSISDKSTQITTFKTVDKTTLQWKEYMSLLVILQLFNLVFITDWFEQFPFKNSVYLTIFFICGYILFAMPIITLYVFLGHYSKRKFLRVWEISPFFKGVGISALLMTLLSTCYNVALVSCAILYVPLTFTMPWKNCLFPGAPKDCISLSDASNFQYNFSSKICCSYSIRSFCPIDASLKNDYVPLNSIWYFRSVMVQNRLSTSHEARYGVINHKLVIISTAVWFLIGTFAILGFSKMKIFLLRFSAFGLAGIAIITIVALVAKSGKKVAMNFTSHNILNFENLGMLVLKLSTRLVPSTFINIGALAPPTALPSIDVLCSGICSLFFMLVFYVFFINVTANLYIPFNLSNGSCIASSGIEVLLAAIPDVLNSLTPILSLLYYIIIILMGLSYSMINSICIVDAMIDQNPKMQLYRWNLVVIICFVSAVITLSFFMPVSEFNFEIWFNRLDHFYYLFLVVFFLIPLFWIYGFKVVICDIEFKYKDANAFDFWKFCWKVIPFFTVFIFLGSISSLRKLYEEIPKILGLQKIFTTLSLVVVLPIPIAAIVHYFSELKNVSSAISNISTLTKHLESWGPADPIEFKARQRFEPVREIGFKSEFYLCHHKCFKYSKSLEQEKQRIQQCIQKTKYDIDNASNYFT